MVRHRDRDATKTNLTVPVVPVNQALVDLSKQYQKDTPNVLAPRINAARDFLINVIAPSLLALDNGLQDGVEVLRLAMEEEPQAGKYFNMLHTMMEQALRVKMANFISEQCGLNEQERFMFLELSLRKEADRKPPQQTIVDLIKELGGDAKTPLGNSEKPAPNPRLQRRQKMAMLNRETDSTKERK